MPVASRLLDRMEKAGLVSRVRDAEDRRQVTSRITAKGAVLVSELGPIVEAGHRRHLDNLSEKQVRKLIKLLTLVRETT
jgi:DNA-binding MarR family transcriptional regulator